MLYDVLIKNGTFFDGTGQPGCIRDIGVMNGRVVRISETALSESDARRVINANGHWVTPGFIDMHTHYDAELEIAPSLSESLRHGVTTVVVGSCSIDFGLGTPDVVADMFCRVEAIPDSIVRPLLMKTKTWSTLDEYVERLKALPLGPNVATLLGHSNLRAHVMGVERSLDRSIQPDKNELAKMGALLERALDLGYLGLSIQTSPWDKMGGNRDYRSRPLPSAFARWREYRYLTRILRRRGKIFQGVPDLTTRINVILFLLESCSLRFRKTLKTTIISMMDIRSDRTVYWITGALSRVFNRFFGADFKWQALPEPFDLWADGIDLVVFEEFGAGAAALHLQAESERKKLLKDPDYRSWFGRQWRNRLLPKAFHRNLSYSKILSAPDPQLVGKSFSEIAKEQGENEVDTFLDLVAEHGDAIRWYTMMANDRPRQLQWVMSHPDILIGFTDAGAHLRNMAHYNYNLRMLKQVQDSISARKPFMTVERAVHRLTAEIADWLGIDAGRIAVGKRADLVVIDPNALDARLDEAHEEPMEGMAGFRRMVRRSDGAVKTVLVNGRVAFESDMLAAGVGKERGYGTYLSAAAN